MSRRSVVCQMRHTPLSPIKNRVRRDWMSGVKPTKDIITISHGLLDVASILQWQGAIQVCDIDPGVREITEYLRGDYEDLNILTPGDDIRTTVTNYCTTFGVKNLGAVDVDLACNLWQAASIFTETLEILAQHKYRGKVFLTVCLRSDGFDSMLDRINWLKERLPAPFKYVKHTVYSSIKIADNAQRSKGSAMCIVEVSSQRNVEQQMLFPTLADHIFHIIKTEGCANVAHIHRAMKRSGYGGHGNGTQVYREANKMFQEGWLTKVDGFIQKATRS